MPPIHLDLLDGFHGFLIDWLPIVAFSQHVPETDFGVAEKTDFEIPVTCDPQTIAGPAKVVCHARDEPNPTHKSGDFERLACVICLIPHLLQTRILLSDHFQHLLVAQHLPLCPFIAIEGHVLDEPDLDIFFPPHLHKGYDFAFIDTAHDDAIYFQLDAGTEAVHFEYAVNAADYGGKALPAGHDLELERIEGIKGEIDACEACFCHDIELSMEGDPVGC